MSEITGKVILITGASSGIGKALAIQYAAPHIQLILASRNLDELQKVKVECEQFGAKCNVYYLDIASSESIQQCVSQIKSEFKFIHCNSLYVLKISKDGARALIGDVWMVNVQNTKDNNNKKCLFILKKYINHLEKS